jgi:uncharacterized protein (TIGR03905 family)
MYEYKTKGVCSAKITFEVENDKVKNVQFFGGCSGSSTGISKLVEGMKINDIIEKVEGTKCGSRGSSCPDQLANALKEYKNKNE